MLPHGFKVTFILKLADIESATTDELYYAFVGDDVLGVPRGHKVTFASKWGVEDVAPYN